MATFVLVHGASHGAWCWDLLVPELVARNARAVTVDCPVEDVTAGLDAYAQAVADAAAVTSDPVIVVGHSLAGCCIPLVARKRPVARLVFLCAVIPIAGLSGIDQAERDPEMLLFPRSDRTVDELGRGRATPELARDAYYNDCSDDLVAWAVPQLRYQSPLPMSERFPENGWTDTPTTSILCTEDRSVNPAWSRRVAKERLGSDAIELPGGHSPFLSRPAVLAETLISLDPSPSGR